MKPKDLKAVFSFKERRPLMQDGIFYVPAHYQNYHEFSFPSWREIFGNDNPVHIEFCTGNGNWIEKRALDHSQINWVAVEIRFDRIRKIWSKMKNQKLANLFAVCGDGMTFAKEYVSKDSVEQIFINFPDPWPKDKHAKHRLLKPAFLDQMARILSPEGKVTFVTDDEPYLQETLSHFEAHKEFQTLVHTHDLGGYGDSYFYSLWKEKGREIHYTEFAHATDS